MSNGNFVQFRRGIVEHVEEGRLSLREFACYTLMILLANKSNGVWMGSATALSAKYGAGDLDRDAAKNILGNLQRKGYINRALKEQGARGNYPIFIDKYPITFGPLSGRYVNAAESTDKNNPVCYSSPEDTPETTPETTPERPPYSIPQYSNTSKKRKSTSREVDVHRMLARYSDEEQRAFAEVWPYYLDKCERDPSKYAMLPERITKFMMRFAELRKNNHYEGSVAFMKQAVDGLAGDDFCMGRSADSNGKGPYHDFIDNLFKNYAEMEKRFNKATSASRPRSTVKPATGEDADRKLEEAFKVARAAK